jgi:hypothetical protein
MITIHYISIDGASIRRSFKTIAGAEKFARKWIGANPEIGSSYAVSGDGVGKVTVKGCTLDELFSVQRAKKFNEQYNAAKYNEGAAETFEFGVDDSVKTYLETGADGSSEYYHYSYWSNDNGEWCYVHHDTNGDYYAAVALGDCAEIGLRVDVPKPAKPVKLPKSATLRIMSFEDGASVGMFVLGQRIFVARGNYVARVGRTPGYFQAIEGSVKLIAGVDAPAEYDRIKAIDAAFWRAKERERQDAAEEACMAAEIAEELAKAADDEPTEPTHAELEAAGQWRLF